MAVQQGIYSNKMDNDRFVVGFYQRALLECVYTDG